MRLGRTRTARHWGPRIIDLDLLMFENREMGSDELTLPHPRMHERAFVLAPLMEIAPVLEIPGKGTLPALLNNIADQPIEKIEGWLWPEL